MNSQTLQQRFFLLLLALVTIAFMAVLYPFYGAVFWALILAMLFAPLQRVVLRRMPSRPNLAALISLAVIMFLVILPISLILVALVRQATAIYGRITSGEIDFGLYLQQILSLMPAWAHSRMAELGLLDIAGVQERLREGLAQIGHVVAPQAINIGQNTLQFLVSLGIMLYLLYFLLRDGRTLAAHVSRAIPLAEEQKLHLLRNFVTVIKATVKGNIAVAATQGALGGLILWLLGIQGVLLWSVVMAFLSLLPAVGAGLIWGPIALYFLATGATWQGIVLIAYGIFVIGLVDNALRPILVGKDTKLPDYMVLITTIGGLTLFGLNGFVIGPLIAVLFVAAWNLFVSPEKVRAETHEEVREEARREAIEEAADRKAIGQAEGRQES
ncbi:MAG: AI-2E family transporter [Burkholderiaceae bacterium]|nr:AI-2E family transporter [Burkholderiaceae bacterium]MEB2318434.1 AI-2E family transporter [Pseudomonadota bacterium]